MTAGWVAGAVRARAMARRVLGADAARQLAGCQSLPEALRMLETTPLRDAAEPGLSLAAAQHAVAETILWNLRVLAGWLPRDGVSLLRLLAGWFEIANVDELLHALGGQPMGAEFQLGALATAWPRVSAAGSPAEVRHILAASAWGDPGGDTSLAIRAGLRARWVARLTGSGEPIRTWAGAAARIASLATPVRPRLARPGRTQPALQEVPAAEPWQAEADWWRRVEREGRVLLHSSVTDSGPVLGAIVVMAADARRVRASLASAARGLAPEAYDALV
jgi:hypothetical protein